MTEARTPPFAAVLGLSLTHPDVVSLLAKDPWTVSDMIHLSSDLARQVQNVHNLICSWRVPAEGAALSDAATDSLDDAELRILTAGHAIPIMLDGFSPGNGEDSFGAELPAMSSRTDDEICSIVTRLVSRLARPLKLCLAHVADPLAFSNALQLGLRVEFQHLAGAAVNLPVPVMVAGPGGHPDAVEIYQRVRERVMSFVTILHGCATQDPIRSRLASQPDLIDLIVGAVPFGEHLQEAFRGADRTVE